MEPKLVLYFFCPPPPFPCSFFLHVYRESLLLFTDTITTYTWSSCVLYICTAIFQSTGCTVDVKTRILCGHGQIKIQIKSSFIGGGGGSTIGLFEGYDYKWNHRNSRKDNIVQISFQNKSATFCHECNFIKQNKIKSKCNRDIKKKIVMERTDICRQTPLVAILILQKFLRLCPSHRRVSLGHATLIRSTAQRSLQTKRKQVRWFYEPIGPGVTTVPSKGGVPFLYSSNSEPSRVFRKSSSCSLTRATSGSSSEGLPSGEGIFEM